MIIRPEGRDGEEIEITDQEIDAVVSSTDSYFEIERQLRDLVSDKFGRDDHRYNFHVVSLSPRKIIHGIGSFY